MLKSKSPLTKLSSAIAFCLIAGSASADTVYSTKKYLLDQNDAFIGNQSTHQYGSDPVNKGDWFAGYFYVPKAQTNPANPATVCQNGCDITGVSLYLISRPPHPTRDPFSFDDITLQVFSNTEDLNDWDKYPGDPLFTLTNPEPQVFFGTKGGPGTLISFTANPQDQNAPALLQPGTGYWLKLTRDSESDYEYDFSWYYNGLNKPGEYYAAGYGDGVGSPYIFEVRGTNSVTPRLAPLHAPIPGAVWMMGTALIGFLVTGRKKSPE